MEPDVEQVKCGICGRPRTRDLCVIVELTAEERAHLRSTGVEPVSEYIYCKPCWGTLGDKQVGPRFGKGLLQQQLQQLGVANAELVATNHHARLVALIEKKNKTS